MKCGTQALSQAQNAVGSVNTLQQAATQAISQLPTSNQNSSTLQSSQTQIQQVTNQTELCLQQVANSIPPA